MPLYRYIDIPKKTHFFCPFATTQDADPFELSVSCVDVVPCLAPAEFCTTLSSQRHQNVFEKPKASPLNHRCVP